MDATILASLISAAAAIIVCMVNNKGMQMEAVTVDGWLKHIKSMGGDNHV